MYFHDIKRKYPDKLSNVLKGPDKLSNVLKCS
jgi:hypothetical protein